ncbi:MAG: ATP-dependent helicase [Micrococcales bacterium]|nr:ATP-dependent helicase [Micrococcales bacterium]
MAAKEVPTLTGDALSASESKASHIQIIASAGAGKTETISQRVGKLIRDGAEPSEIVAFTFTVKAAEEIKERIRERVRKFAGQDAADKIGMMYVGTIHGYCLQFLQQNVPQYETYDMVDENQLAAFTIRWDMELGLRQFDIDRPEGKKRLFEGMRTFLANVAVLENDLIDLESLPEDLANFKTAVRRLYELLDQHRMLTFGMQIGRAIDALQDPINRSKISSGIKHLIVDEYQDVNIAQEKLVQLLSKPIGTANLVVVGDDDQAIYQWRGSSVENITTFNQRYPDVETYRLLTNFRSRPGIVNLANAFASTIQGRLPKVMKPFHEVNGPSVDIADDFELETHEANDIAESIQRLVRSGYKYSDIAILVRAGTTYPRLLDALEKKGVPVSPGDRLGLLEQADALFLARVFAYFADMDWKPSKYAEAEQVHLADLISYAEENYSVDKASLERFFIKTKAKVGQDSRKISLVELLYELYSFLGVQEWTQDDNVSVGRLGTMAKFSSMVGDYEGIQKHARLNDDGSQTGATDQRDWYFKGLVILMSQFARDSYRDFGGEDDVTVDAVDLMTVHAAKGLEWPIVFIPAVTGKRFPSSRVGQGPSWIIPRNMFDADRYEGTINDERRLFYVALTRAREWVSISSHEKVNKQRGSQSPFMEQVLKSFDDTPGYPPEWTKDRNGEIDGVLQISYSDLSAYLNCGWSYWLRNRIGFPSVLVESLGYGKAIHHLMRVIAEQSTLKGRPLNAREVDKLLATDFFLPFANKVVAENLKTAAGALVDRYLNDYAEDTTRTWQTERPFELEVKGGLIIGRADVILDMHDGEINNLAIVDYKTAVGEQEFDLQLRIYAEAGTREGLRVQGAYVHDLTDATRKEVVIDESSRRLAVTIAEKAVQGIKNREFEAQPNFSKCSRCDVRAICLSAAKKAK